VGREYQPEPFDRGEREIGRRGFKAPTMVIATELAIDEAAGRREGNIAIAAPHPF
jgi:hypothetical protein